LYRLWTGLARFIEGTGFGSVAWRPAAAGQVENGATAPLETLAMTDGSKALVWVLDPRYAFPQGADQEGELVTEAETVVYGLPDGAYTVEWWDTRAGRVVETSRATCQGGRLRLTAIPFVVDVAARMIPAL
jgi:hypothetical protein